MPGPSVFGRNPHSRAGEKGRDRRSTRGRGRNGMTATTDVAGKPRVSPWNDPRQTRRFLSRSYSSSFLPFSPTRSSTIRSPICAAGNISSGFDFLSKSSGFDIIQSLIPYSSNSTYGRALFVGFLNTLLISAFGIVARHDHRLRDGHHAAVEELAASRRLPRSTSRSSATSRCCCGFSSFTARS